MQQEMKRKEAGKQKMKKMLEGKLRKL